MAAIIHEAKTGENETIISEKSQVRVKSYSLLDSSEKRVEVCDNKINANGPLE